MLKSIAFVTGLALALPAAAQVTSIASSNPAPKGGDPNKKICERVQKTGSRLGAVTVCMTANEWKDVRLGQRQEVEKVQSQRTGFRYEGN